jgi:hypothetical protein
VDLAPTITCDRLCLETAPVRLRPEGTPPRAEKDVLWFATWILGEVIDMEMAG